MSSSHVDPPSRRTAAAVLAGLAALVLVLTGCSAASDSGGEDSAEGAFSQVAGDDTGDRVAAAGEDGAADQDDAADLASGPGSAEAGGDASLVAADQVPGEGRMIARDASLAVQVTDVLEAASRVRAAAVAADGWVSSEEVHPAEEGEEGGFATLVLSVPSTALEGTMDQVTAVGRVTARGITTDDVTLEFRDAEARIATLEASVTRLRELVDEAGSVDEIARLESELSRREADLDALKARRNALQEDVSRSSLTVHLAEDVADLAEAEAEQSGFLAGLRAGWAAFLTSLGAIATTAGALLPFLALAALVGLPLWRWRRSRDRRSQPGAATPVP